MEIYDLLREDHAELLARAKRLAAAPRDAAAVDALVSHFEFHDLFEREVLYPAIATAPSGSSATAAALEEHAALDALLEEMSEAVAGGPQAPDWPGQIGRLRRALEAHVTREEGPLFDLAHRSIAASDAADMADKYRAARRKLLDR